MSLFLQARVGPRDRILQLSFDAVILRHPQRAGGDVLDLFRQNRPVRLAVLCPLDAAALKVIDLLRQLATLLKQARHHLERFITVGKPAGVPARDDDELVDGFAPLAADQLTLADRHDQRQPKRRVSGAGANLDVRALWSTCSQQGQEPARLRRNLAQPLQALPACILRQFGAQSTKSDTHTAARMTAKRAETAWGKCYSLLPSTPLWPEGGLPPVG
jgi:hypothetical protein